MNQTHVQAVTAPNLGAGHGAHHKPKPRSRGGIDSVLGLTVVAASADRLLEAGDRLQEGGIRPYEAAINLLEVRSLQTTRNSTLGSPSAGARPLEVGIRPYEAMDSVPKVQSLQAGGI